MELEKYRLDHVVKGKQKRVLELSENEVFPGWQDQILGGPKVLNL